MKNHPARSNFIGNKMKCYPLKYTAFVLQYEKIKLISQTSFYLFPRNQNSLRKANSIQNDQFQMKMALKLLFSRIKNISNLHRHIIFICFALKELKFSTHDLYYYFTIYYGYVQVFWFANNTAPQIPYSLYRIL